MINYINYLLEVSICLGVFYFIYRTLLQKETFFQLNRFFLLLSLGLALVIPLINIDLSSPLETQILENNEAIAPLANLEFVESPVIIDPKPITTDREFNYSLLLIWMGTGGWIMWNGRFLI